MLQTFASKVTFISSGTIFCGVMTIIRYLFIFIFNFWTLRMKIWVHLGLWLVSRSSYISCSTSRIINLNHQKMYIFSKYHPKILFRRRWKGLNKTINKFEKNKSWVKNEFNKKLPYQWCTRHLQSLLPWPRHHRSKMRPWIRNPRYLEVIHAVKSRSAP